MTRRKRLMRVPYRRISSTIRRKASIVAIFALSGTQRVSTTTIGAKHIRSILLGICDSSSFLCPKRRDNFMRRSLRRIITRVRGLPKLRLTKLARFPYLL